MALDNIALTYLVWGATRGIGKAIVAELLQRQGTTVIAVVRPSSSTKEIEALSKAKGARLLIVAIDTSDFAGSKTTIASFANDNSISSIDVVIANAGVNRMQPSAVLTSAEALRFEFETNTLGPLSLFQATIDLLRASKQSPPKYILLSTLAASSTLQDKITASVVGYSATKAAALIFGQRWAFEEKDIATLMIHPGSVDTDMQAQALKDSKEMAEVIKMFPPISPKESALNVMKVVDNSTIKDSGRFINADDGQNFPF